MSAREPWVVIAVDEDDRPDEVYGPFETQREAERWALAQPGGVRFWRQRLNEPSRRGVGDNTE